MKGMGVFLLVGSAGVVDVGWRGRGAELWGQSVQDARPDLWRADVAAGVRAGAPTSKAGRTRRARDSWERRVSAGEPDVARLSGFANDLEQGAPI